MPFSLERLIKVCSSKLRRPQCDEEGDGSKASMPQDVKSRSGHAKIVYCHSPQCLCRTCNMACAWKSINDVLVHQGGLRGAVCRGCSLQLRRGPPGGAGAGGHASYDPKCRDCHVASTWAGLQRIHEQLSGGGCLHLFSCEQHSCCDTLDAGDLGQLDALCTNCLIDSIWEGLRASLRAVAVLTGSAAAKLLLDPCNSHGLGVYSSSCRDCRVASIRRSAAQLDAALPAGWHQRQEQQPGLPSRGRPACHRAGGSEGAPAAPCAAFCTASTSSSNDITSFGLGTLHTVSSASHTARLSGSSTPNRSLHMETKAMALCEISASEQ